MHISKLLYSLHLTLPISALHLLPRKSTSRESYDPYIVCNGESPTHAEGLPLVFSEAIYTSRLALCSAAHGARQNVGCFCSSPHSYVHCNPDIADLLLYTALYRSAHEDIAHEYQALGFAIGQVPFPRLCESDCFCTTAEIAGEGRRRTARTSSNMAVASASGSAQQAPSNTASATESSASAGVDVGAGMSEGTVSAGDCSDVPGGDELTCTCPVQEPQSQSRPETAAFGAACQSILGPRRKRAVGRPLLG